MGGANYIWPQAGFQAPPHRVPTAVISHDSFTWTILRLTCYQLLSSAAFECQTFISWFQVFYLGRYTRANCIRMEIGLYNMTLSCSARHSLKELETFRPGTSPTVRYNKSLYIYGNVTLKQCDSAISNNFILYIAQAELLWANKLRPDDKDLTDLQLGLLPA